MAGWHIGVIGGSDFPDGIELDDAQQIAVASAFGEPSGPVTTGLLEGVHVTFIARHGADRRLSPSQVNYRANIDVLKRCGVTDVLATSAVVSLRDDLAAGDFLAVEQVIDRTLRGERSFFDVGIVAHVGLDEPVCPRLTECAVSALEQAGGQIHRSCCYLAIEGPRWPTRAEAALYRQWGADVVGMTAMPEAGLAREAELPYALLATVRRTDAAFSGSPDSTGPLATLLRRVVRVLPEVREDSPIDRALDGAIATLKEGVDRSASVRLDAVAARWLQARGPDS